MSSPRVSVIIASYNGLGHLQICLPSVSRSQYPDFEIVVCDDCSTDGTLAYLQDYARREPRLKIVRNERNLGASATRNQAVRHADGAILVLLDNDTEVEPDWLRELVAVMESAPGVGAAQAALVVFESRDQIQLTGAELLPQACWGIPLEQGINPAERSLQSREIIALSTATAVRRDVFDQVGGFDEKLAVYSEDLEFSWRVWIAGWRILSAPRAVIYHRSAKDRSGMGGTLRHIYFNMGKNTLRSLTKNHGGWRLWRYLPVAVLTLAGRAVFRLFLGDTGCFRATARAFGWYFATLPDTLRERRFVQRGLRRRPDREIAAAVFSKKSWLGMIAYYVRCNYLPH